MTYLTGTFDIVARFRQMYLETYIDRMYGATIRAEIAARETEESDV
jgi:hypothetical protein